MKYEKMMEKNLTNHFGEIQKVSEADWLVFEDDQILIDHDWAKERRAIRFDATDRAKKRKASTHKVADYGFRKNYQSIKTGKVKNPCDPRRGRKVRHSGKEECRYEEEKFNPRCWEFRKDNTPDWILEKYQTPELTWELEYAMFPAWYDYSYEMTMRVEDEYATIYNSLKKMIEYNKILQSSKLTKNLTNIIETLSDNHKW